jgi:hypothetical protein
MMQLRFQFCVALIDRYSLANSRPFSIVSIKLLVYPMDSLSEMYKLPEEIKLLGLSTIQVYA